MRYIYTILFICLFNFQSNGSNCASTGDGNWYSVGTWSCGFVPGCVDTIIISTGDSVYIDNHVDLIACGPVVVIIYGVIEFKTGRKMKLAEGSQVILMPGAKMRPGGGGGSSNYLEIGGNEVWHASDGTASGPLTYTSGGVLPIKLVSFEANFNVDRVNLKWVTSTEINNDFFTIEKSKDLKNWEVVSIVSGAGNSSVIMEYFEVDYSPEQGVSYYRLKQTDYDGAFSYSNIVPVKAEIKSDGGEFNLFPNPVKRGEELKIQFSEFVDTEILVVIRDVKGEEFYSKAILHYESGLLIAVPMDKEIPTGIYIVTASSEDQIYSQKLIVK
ncbi:MAG: T9SS type A sorting domain-containing protein [Flavobacteriales bacterium]